MVLLDSSLDGDWASSLFTSNSEWAGGDAWCSRGAESFTCFLGCNLTRGLIHCTVFNLLRNLSNSLLNWNKCVFIVIRSLSVLQGMGEIWRRERVADSAKVWRCCERKTWWNSGTMAGILGVSRFTIMLISKWSVSLGTSSSKLQNGIISGTRGAV